MSRTLAVESLGGLVSSWDEWRHSLQWGSIFVIPAWLEAWRQAFGGGADLYLGIAREGDDVTGFAPLQLRDKTASFMGSADVCDYLDFAISPGRERDFFETLLDDLWERDVQKLKLAPVRPDSTVLTHLVDIARGRGYEVRRQPEDVSLELDLPTSWEEYLTALSTKQRHEVRRKLRRLWQAGNAEYRCVTAGRELRDHVDVFLKLFALSRDDKASFMNRQMESFFRSMTRTMTEIGLLTLGILEVAGRPAAMTMGFDCNDTYYLYNSAYDPEFSQLSAGLLSKVLCLKDAIEQGRKRWDFLKGSEPYKYRLGGHEVPLYSCEITMAQEGGRA